MADPKRRGKYVFNALCSWVTRLGISCWEVSGSRRLTSKSSQSELNEMGLETRPTVNPAITLLSGAVNSASGMHPRTPPSGAVVESIE